MDNTELNYAIFTANIDKVNRILNKGVNPNRLDQFRRTSLHYAAIFATKNSNILLSLIDHGANLNIKDIEGNTPLMYLLNVPFDTIAFTRIYGRYKIELKDKECASSSVKLLLNSGANPNICNRMGEFPTHLALSSFDREILNLLG